MRDPVDICRLRRESAVVLGNCGVVRILKPGPAVSGIKEGDICILTGNAISDRYGYMIGAHAFDAPNTVGIMAKETKVAQRQLIPIPRDQGFSLMQWAAFSLRYVTAWANWKVAYGCWRLQVPTEANSKGFAVWGWGGGVAFAELDLAKRTGAACAMIASREKRLRMAEEMGFIPIDRREFADLRFDRERYEQDRTFKSSYLQAEKRFLEIVKAKTQDEGVAIFIENIGEPVFSATLKALAREGVFATAGWKCGPRMQFMRQKECIGRRTFVHTHYASHQEAHDSVRFACAEKWMVPQEHLNEVFAWQEIGRLSTLYAHGELDSYFPIFSIHPE